MIRSKILCVFILLFTINSAFAQDSNFNKATLYVEVLGISQTAFSLNCERILYLKKDTSILFALRVGISTGNNKYDNDIILIFPLEFNILYGRNKHYLEFGVGWIQFIGTSNLNDTLIPKNEKSNINYGISLRLGYRYQPKKKAGLMFRAAPLVEFESNLPNTKLTTRFGVGFSFGFVF